jgi:hypothetical protein
VVVTGKTVTFSPTDGHFFTFGLTSGNTEHEYRIEGEFGKLPLDYLRFVALLGLCAVNWRVICGRLVTQFPAISAI